MYIIIGANGFLGSYLIKNIIDKTDEKIVATFRNYEENHLFVERVLWEKCDISNANEVDIFINKVNNIKESKKVIYLAAYHNPDFVEDNFSLAWNINVTQLSYILNKLDNVKAFFYPSTDTVYGDSINNYHFKETDLLNPQNSYGKQKIVAENLVLGYGYNVVRFPFLIGESLLVHKKHFYDKIKESLETNSMIDMLVDSYRSSIDFNTASDILITIIENYMEKAPKLLNICGDRDLSKYDIAILISEKYGLKNSCIIPIYFSESNSFFKANRAKTTLMDNSELKKLLQLDSISINI